VEVILPPPPPPKPDVNLPPLPQGMLIGDAPILLGSGRRQDSAAAAPSAGAALAALLAGGALALAL
jgi:hypothetical protein